MLIFEKIFWIRYLKVVGLFIIIGFPWFHLFGENIFSVILFIIVYFGILIFLRKREKD